MLRILNAVNTDCSILHILKKRSKSLMPETQLELGRALDGPRLYLTLLTASPSGSQCSNWKIERGKGKTVYARLLADKPISQRSFRPES